MPHNQNAAMKESPVDAIEIEHVAQVEVETENPQIAVRRSARAHNPAPVYISPPITSVPIEITNQAAAYVR